MIRGSGISSCGTGASPASNTALSKEVIHTTTVGNNTVAHGLTGDILWVNVKDSNNRVIEFSDLYWDSTKIYIWADEEINITFVIAYTN